MNPQHTPAKPKQITIIGAIVVLITLIIVTVIGITSSSNPTAEDLSEETTNDTSANSTDDAPRLSIENPTYFQSYISSTIYNKFQSDLEFLATLPEEASNPGSALTAVIDNPSLENSIYFPYTTYSFQLNLSDDRTYQVHFASSGELIFSFILQRINPATATPPYFYIHFLEPELDNNYDRDDVVAGLTDWAHSLGFSELLLTTKDD